MTHFGDTIMATPAVLAYLKQTKNAVIGNPTVKLELHQEGVVDKYVLICRQISND